MLASWVLYMAPMTADDLGREIGVHRADPRRILLSGLGGALLFGGLIGLAGTAVGAPLLPTIAFASLTSLLTVGFFLGPSWRHRNTQVRIFRSGVVVDDNGRQAQMSFDTVTELWLPLEPGGNWLTFNLAHFNELTLFDGKRRLVVPLVGSRVGELLDTVLPPVTTRLLQEARRALASGSAVAFGHVSVAPEGIEVGGRGCAWKDLILTVVQPAALLLHRRSTLVPWSTINLAKVPNPFVLKQLVVERSRKVELDDGFMAPSDTDGG